MHVKDKSCNSLQGFRPATLLKETPKRVFFCEYSESFSDSFSYRTTPVTAFELCFSIRNFFLKKSREIGFELISLFHVQIQEPISVSTTIRAFVFLAKFDEFYYHKVFETRSRWQPKPLHGWRQPLWPLYNWRYKDLSRSRDEKAQILLWRSALSTFNAELLLLPKFDSSCPSVPRDKRLSRVVR